MSAAPSGGSPWRACEGPLVDHHDAVLLDLDGVVYVAEHAVAEAVSAVGTVRERGCAVAFVTNNAARTPQAVAEHLAELGIPAEAADVVTSAQAAARMLQSCLPAGAPVLVIGAEGLRAAVSAVGLRPVAAMQDRPQAVVQGFSPETGWQMLVEACVAVRAGLPWIATNLDATLPTPRGPAPGNGAFVDVVRRTTGVQPQVAGKPRRPLIDEAVRRTGASCALVVGDRLDTDLAGARAAGLPGLLVLTGVSAIVDLLTAAPSQRPDHLAANLQGLLATHPAPSWRDGWWVEGAARARWASEASVDRLELHVADSHDGQPAADTGASAALAVVRTVCAATWQRCDAGDREVRLSEVRSAVRPWTAPLGWDR